jgi:hypothetical protein
LEGPKVLEDAVVSGEFTKRVRSVYGRMRDFVIEVEEDEMPNIEEEADERGGGEGEDGKETVDVDARVVGTSDLIPGEAVDGVGCAKDSNTKGIEDGMMRDMESL